MDQCKLFKLADEIDHYTIKLPEKEVTDRDTAIKMIYHYSFADKAVENKFSFAVGELENTSSHRLFEILREIREVFIKEAFDMN